MTMTVLAAKIVKSEARAGHVNSSKRALNRAWNSKLVEEDEREASPKEGVVTLLINAFLSPVSQRGLPFQSFVP